MWLISLLPEWFIHLATLGSMAALLISIFLGSIIPAGYRVGVQVLAAALLSFCLYLEGGIANEASWKLKEAQIKQEIAELNNQRAEATIQVVTKYIDRVKVVKEKGNVIIQEVPKYITQTDNDRCVLPDSVRMLHDAAIEGEIKLPGTTGNPDGKAGAIKEAATK
jgi:hypothetical protein